MECKVHSWKEELYLLRLILLDSGLSEEIKWSMPCYTLNESNVAMLSAFKHYVSVSFFKGVLLKDPGGLLVAPGKNSQASRQFRFTNISAIEKQDALIRDYLKEAIALEKAGKQVIFKKSPEPIPVELLEKLENDPVLKAAFESLTPGRQRGYILYFSGAKQSATRLSRIEKYIPKILAGKGFHDR
jgi:uncharacterized protein YdeI (YjbR/CyaY-like superfamily)